NKLFIFSSILFFLITALFLHTEMNPEWRDYQVTFQKMALDRAKTDEERTAILEEGIGIRQIIIPELGIIERCPTCHAGVDNPDFKDDKIPYKYHSPVLSEHKLNKYGCCICHGGQGLATTKKAAHGNVSHWHNPVFKRDYVQASCGKCHFETFVEGAPLLAVGKRLFEFYGCINCHKRYKTGGAAGPDLTKVASKEPQEFVWGDYKGERALVEWLYLHFKDTTTFQEDSKMSNYKMDDFNAKALTIYMLSLVDENYPEKYYVGEKPRMEEAE
ncbi:MAG: c-type cytochrome, partial [Thermodesulfobacteriota bacterium]|nr:c-type cytochrome [Thermodesulfobacteriota bacterium]